MSALTKWWTAQQLDIARQWYPEAGAFREDAPAGGGAYGCNLSTEERAVLARIDWSTAWRAGEDPAEYAI